MESGETRFPTAFCCANRITPPNLRIGSIELPQKSLHRLGKAAPQFPPLFRAYYADSAELHSAIPAKCEVEIA
jgi:hypothetical protein